MVKKVLTVLALAVLVLSIGSCKKKEESPIPEMGAPGPMMPPVGESQVIVPETIKGKWSAVTLTIEDKSARKAKEVNVPIGGEYSIPGSKLKVQVGDFLPDFRMEGSIITSASPELNNPAVKITVMEGDKEIFKGWLYSKFPAIHPFQHDKFAITLKDVVKKA